MEIILTGASGFIGSNLVDFFIKKKILFSIISSNNNSKKKLKKKFKNKINFFNKINPKKKYILLHCASPNDITSNKNFKKSCNGNLLYTYKIIDLIKNSNLKQIIYLSTAQVYGLNLKKNVTEKTPLMPTNNYGLFHKFTEDLIFCLKSQFNLKCKIIILRVSNVLGMPKIYSKNIFRLLPQDICKNLKKNNKALMKSSGKQYRNFISITNLLEIIYKIINKNINTGIYNIGDKNMPVINLVKKIIDIYNNNSKLIINNQNPKKIQKLNFKSNKILNEINFKSKNNLNKTINDILQSI
tara:strand:- start:2553 stop:3446 length:894 start_codon:yes stop_codon:yes gene_type:complete